MRRISGPRFRSITALSAAVLLLAAPRAQGQAAPAFDPLIQPATAADATSSRPSPGAPTVRFRQQAASVGDRLVQRVGVHLEIATKITQSGQTAHQSTNEMRRQQQRTIEVLEVAEGRAVTARASFEQSRRQSPENADPNVLAPQPIEGKSYLMIRDGEKLSITDAAGAIPPLEEYKLVAESLENVGKPNPLAELLVNRPLAVGQRLLVPRDMVQPMLGFDEPIGKVHRFELKLVHVEPATAERPAAVGVFEVHIEVQPDEKSPLEISLSGQMSIETETCRLLAVDLAGPVQISSIERTEGGIYQFSAGGDLKMAIRSQYDRAAK